MKTAAIGPSSSPLARDAASTRATFAVFVLIFAAAFAASLAVWASAWRSSGDHWLWPKHPDDAFYYFQVARNFVAGRGLSMDGLNETNGFHPLWMAILIGLAWLVPLEADSWLMIIQVISLGLFSLVFAGVAIVATRQSGLAAAVAALALMAFPRYLNVLTSAMESGLLVVILILSCALFVAYIQAPGKRLGLALGTTLGLLILARLDSVFIVASMVIVSTVHPWIGGSASKRSVRPLVTAALAPVIPPTIALAAYLAWNWSNFGHLSPISGTLKSSFPRPAPALGVMTSYIEFCAIPLFGWLLVALRPFRDRPHSYMLLLALTAGTTLHLAHTVLFMSWAVFNWHFATYIILAVLAVAALAERAFLGRKLSSVVFICIAAWGSTTSLLTYSLIKPDTRFLAPALEAGRWAKRHLHPDALLAMKDSGAFTYASERRVSNLDGLISSYEYQSALCGGQLTEFLKAQGTEYIVQHAVSARPGYRVFRQEYPCHLRGGTSGALNLREADEVFRGTPYNHGGEQVSVVIWRFNPTPASTAQGRGGRGSHSLDRANKAAKRFRCSYKRCEPATGYRLLRRSPRAHAGNIAPRGSAS